MFFSKQIGVINGKISVTSYTAILLHRAKFGCVTVVQALTKSLILFLFHTVLIITEAQALQTYFYATWVRGVACQKQLSQLHSAGTCGLREIRRKLG